MNTTRDTIHHESQKDPARLEREIDQQRDHIGDIVQALESKVSPQEIVDRVVAYGKDNGGDLVRNLGAAVRDNPVPALLTAAGLLWMYSSRNQPPAHAAPYLGGSAYRAGTAGLGGNHEGGTGVHGNGSSTHDDGGLRERAAHLRDSASETWHQTTSRLGDGVHHARDSMQATTRRARGGYEHMLHDNPMAAGAIAVAVGALLGAALPTTARERELMGPVGEKLADKARDVAGKAKQQGAETARALGTPSGDASAEPATSGGASAQSPAGGPGPARAG